MRSRLARFALALQAVAEETAQRFGLDLRLRIGLASGPVMAGVIGARKFTYDVWGDAVNLASRLEGAGEPGHIHVSGAIRDTLANAFDFTCRGRRAPQRRRDPANVVPVGCNRCRLTKPRPTVRRAGSPARETNIIEKDRPFSLLELCRSRAAGPSTGPSTPPLEPSSCLSPKLPTACRTQSPGCRSSAEQD